LRTRLFYGWILVGVAWIIYGFGISPGYYSWAFFSPEIIADLGLTRGDIGFVFGLFTFVYSGIGPLAGIAISRWGVRIVMTAGSLIAALGFYLLSSADSLLECYLYYGLVAGAGIGLSTILPCQTIATTWFVRYRARAVAIIFIAGGVVGRLVTRFDRWMVEDYSWRDGWTVIAGVSLFLAVLAAIFVRDSPQKLGLLPDGAKGESGGTGASADSTTAGPIWTALQAMKTPQFALLCLAGIGYALPWGIVVAHGRLHLQDLGFSTAMAASVLGTMILVSIVGRLTGSLGDFIKPERVLAIAIVLEGLGVVGLLNATAAPLAYASTIAIGLGFGAAYISITVVFANFFGIAAFAKTAGTRFLITGIFNALGPGLAGRIFDSTGSYQSAFLVLIAVCATAGFAAFRLKPPVHKQATS
jgi:MFS family permease